LGIEFVIEWLATVDRRARAQKRFWFAEIRRAVKILRERTRTHAEGISARVWRRAIRLEHETARSVQQRAERSRRVAKIGRERSMNLGVAFVNLTRKAGRRAWGLRRPFVRAAHRVDRWSEQYQSQREERSIEREIERIVDGQEPILFGPWTSEVGYEALYWVAFTRWVKMAYRLKPNRLAVMSRGGVASWYGDVADRYVEIFDHVTPEQFTQRNAERLAAVGTAKQVGITEFDHELIAAATRQLGVESLRVVHPSLMYRLFREFWAGHRPLGFVEEHAKFATVKADPAPGLGLPAGYLAVKFYAAQSLPDTPDNRKLLNRLIDALAEQHEIVLLDTGMTLDEHGEYQFARTSRVTSVREFLRPADNLAVQTQIIAGAKGFVGTCGSVAWLAPFLGVDTLAVMTDARFLHSHLNVARWVYHSVDAGRFSPLDLGAFGPFGLSIRSALPESIQHSAFSNRH